jgi:hypothetical protein
LKKGTNLEIEEDTISPAPRFALTNDDSRHSYEKRHVSNEIPTDYNSPILLPNGNSYTSKNRIWRLTLFPQLGLSLLHRGNNHVANTSVGQPVEAGTETERFYDVQRLGATVVGAIDDGTDGQTESQTKFGAGSSSTLIGGRIESGSKGCFVGDGVHDERKRNFERGENNMVSFVLDSGQRDVPRFAAIFES